MFHPVDSPQNRDGQIRALELERAQQAAAAASYLDLGGGAWGYFSPIGQVLAPKTSRTITGARVEFSATQTINHNQTTVVTAWANEVFDDDDFWSASNSHHLTCPSDGLYQFGANLIFEANPFGYRLALIINDKLTDVTEAVAQVLVVATPQTQPGITTAMSLSGIIRAEAGEHFHCRVLQTSGDDINLMGGSFEQQASSFWVLRLGD